MKQKLHTINCSKIEDIPSLERLVSTPRHIPLRIVFDKSLENLREATGMYWRKKLPKFSIGIHTQKPWISVQKLITDEEIINHQNFFEQCAKDYRVLATRLMTELAKKFNISLNSPNALQEINRLKFNIKTSSGSLSSWNYYLHGFHCAFNHKKSKQVIEACIVNGLEFGDLDPYFFTIYIKSTPEYRPIPIEIYEDYADGVRILEKMVEIGKFEKTYEFNRSRESVVAKNK